MELTQLSADDVADRLPDLGLRSAGGMLVHGAGHVLSPIALSAALAELIRKDGGRIVRGRASGFVFEGSTVRRVTIEGDQSVEADAFVLASGAGSGPLAAALGDRVPLITQRGYHLMLSDPGIDVPTPLLVPSTGLAVTPMQDGLRFAGLVEFADPDDRPNPGRLERIRASARRLFPRIRAEEGRTWLGRRPSLPDGLPVIDKSRRATNAWHAFGHGQMGLTQAAITGHAVAAAMTGQPSPVDMTPYRAARFTVRTGNAA